MNPAAAHSAFPDASPAQLMQALHELLGEVRAQRQELESLRHQVRSIEQHMGSQLLSRAEAAERASCSEKTIIRREKSGALTRLDVEGVGIRYLVSEVDELR